jgi:hypothetical protein
MLRTGRSGVRIPAEVKDLPLLQKSSRMAVVPNQALMGTEGSSPRVKLPGPVSDLPTSSAEIKNEWRCVSTSTLRPHVMYKGQVYSLDFRLPPRC